MVYNLNIRAHNKLKTILRLSGDMNLLVMMILVLKQNPYTLMIQHFDVIFATRLKVNAIDVVRKYPGCVRSPL